MPGRRVGLQHEDSLRGDVGHDQRVGVLLIGERTGLVAVQVERTQPNGADLKGKAEDGSARPRRWPAR